MARAIKKVNTTAMTAYEAGKDDGFEDADSSSFAIPRLKILQKMSPEVDKDDAAFIKGAGAGDFVNTATGLIYDGKAGIKVIPVHFKRSFIEWISRDEGGGFVAEHDAVSGEVLIKTCKRNDKNQDVLPNGHELIDTRTHYLLICNEDGSFDPGVLSATKTLVSESKNWMNKMRSRRLPNGAQAAMFAQVFQLTTAKKENDKGSWSVFKATPVGLVTELKDAATPLDQVQAFRTMIKSGTARVEHNQEGAIDSEAY